MAATQNEAEENYNRRKKLLEVEYDSHELSYELNCECRELTR